MRNPLDTNRDPGSPRNGFTLLELLVAVIILTSATAWALPRLNHKIQQGQVDTYTQNLETGLFNLMAGVRRSAKYCTLFKSNPAKNDYTDPENVIELSQMSANDRNKVIDCPCPSGSSNCDTQFRFLNKEQTSEANLIAVKVSETNYGLSPQGTNPEGRDLIFRIRSLNWEKSQQVFTRCLIVSGNGHLFKGTWDYSHEGLGASACKRFCPTDGNCNSK